MKIRQSIKKERRIILLYIAGLILPGFFLGYLAFRGIQHKKIVQEKQDRQELQLLANQLFIYLDDGIRQYVDSLSATKVSPDPAVMISWSRHPGEDIRILSLSTIFYPDGSLPGFYSPSFDPDFEQAQQLEFANGDLLLAEERYKEIVKGNSIEEIDVKALLALARIYKKTDRFDLAANTYRTLTENYAEYLISDHLPLKALALLELIELYRKMEDLGSLKAATGELLRFLLDPHVAYEKSQFDYLYERWLGLGVEIDSSLAFQLSQAIEKSKYLMVLDGMKEALFSGQDHSFRYLESEKYPGLFIKINDANGIEKGYVLDLDQLIPNILPREIEQETQAGKILWNVKTGIDGKKYGQAPLENPVNVGFPAGLPPWVLQLQIAPDNSVRGLFTSSQGILILVFVFIILLMVMGLIFLMLTLNQEMRLNRMKSQFISNVSHEFKTPLTSIRHMTEVMYLKRIESDERKSEYLKSMLEQCDHLGHLIENILDFSRIEEDVKNYRFESLQLDEILRDLIPVFRGRIQEEDFEIDLQVQGQIPAIMLDKDAMVQVFYNLLDNGYKYSNGGKRIEVTCDFKGKGPAPGLTRGQKAEGKNQEKEEGEKREGGEVVVEVRDWGIGIGEKDLPRIFERFYRGDRLRLEGIKGSGIGLTIVKRIVEAHGGRLEVESQPGEGTTIYIYLPVCKEDVHEEDTAD